MKTVIEMAREAGILATFNTLHPSIEIFAELVRADEREQGQRWFDAVTAQHKQAILTEREACAKVCESKNTLLEWPTYAAAIRARSNT